MTTHRRRTLNESKEEEQVEIILSDKRESLRSRTTSINSPFGAESGYMTSESRSATLDSPLLNEEDSRSTLTRESAQLLISSSVNSSLSMGAAAAATNISTSRGPMLDNFCEHEDDLSDGMFTMSLEDISANGAASSANDSYSPVPCNFNNTPPPGALRLHTHGRFNPASSSHEGRFSELNSTATSFVPLFQRHAATQTSTTSGMLRRSLRTRPASAPLYEELSLDVDDHLTEDDLHPFIIDSESNRSVDATNRGATSAVGWNAEDEDFDIDDNASRDIADPLPDLLPPMRTRSISVPIFDNGNRNMRTSTSGASHIRVAAIQLRELGDEFQLSHSPERRSLSNTVFPLSFSSWRSLTRNASGSGSPSVNSDVVRQASQLTHSWTAQEAGECPHDARSRRRRPSLPLSGSSYPGSSSITSLFDGFINVVSNLANRGSSSAGSESSGQRRRSHRQQFHSESTEN